MDGSRLELIEFLKEAWLGVVGLAGCNKGMELAFLDPALDSDRGDSAKSGSLGESEEITLCL